MFLLIIIDIPTSELNTVKNLNLHPSNLYYIHEKLYDLSNC